MTRNEKYLASLDYNLIIPKEDRDLPRYHASFFRELRNSFTIRFKNKENGVYSKPKKIRNTFLNDKTKR